MMEILMVSVTTTSEQHSKNILNDDKFDFWSLLFNFSVIKMLSDSIVTYLKQKKIGLGWGCGDNFYFLFLAFLVKILTKLGIEIKGEVN